MLSQNEIRQNITNTIIESLKKGNIPWRKPWSGIDGPRTPTNFVTKRRYSGINIPILWAASQERGYDVDYFATFNQWKSIGASVKKTGRDWLEEFESHGYVGRSMGPIKVPLIVANTRSLGGGAILDHCIVRIRTSAGGRVLWQHPSYHHGTLEIRQKTEPVTLPDGRTLTVDVLRDGELQAAFENITKARRYISKLGVRAEIVV